MDNEQVTCLVLLDLSTVFHTVNHSMLLNGLKYMFGVTGQALSWLESYLSDRSQSVIIGECRSKLAVLEQGVPQGSILGPFLFTLYITPLGRICREFGISIQSYADDQQNYVSFKPNQLQAKDISTRSLEECIHNIRKWMQTNKLKLNDDKSEFIVFGTPQQLSKVSDMEICIGCDTIKAAESVRNLGYYMDQHLLKTQCTLTKLSSCLYLLLKTIARIRHLIDEGTCKMIVQALVISKLDYGNSLLLGSAEYELDKLQKIQNLSCWFICNLSKYDHVTDHMKELHWLRIRERITYKVARLAFHCYTDMAPAYLREILPSSHGRTSLRSGSNNTMPVMRSKLSTVHSSSFSSMAPRIWNRLPSEIRSEKNIVSFKTKLKTHLFRISYNIMD